MIVASMLGAVIGSYILLRLLMFITRKVRRRPNDAPEIAVAGLLALALMTVGGGYGMKDGLPDPVFLRAFYTYFGPAMLATVIELVRFRMRSR